MAKLNPRRHVSITDVAERAGVSITTVSHVLSGRRPVSEATRTRVQGIIAELGYEPNQLARGLRLQRTRTIALIIPNITNPFYPWIARGLQDAVSAAGYHVVVSSTDAVPGTERSVINEMITRRVDGIAFATYHNDTADLDAAVKVGIPVVLLGGRTPSAGIDVVSADDLAGGEIATRYLLGRGYRRIGFITGPQRKGPPANRVIGCRRALKQAGIPAATSLIVREEFSREGGARGMAQLLGLSQPPDAVLCTNDVVAVGALQTALGRGLRVPEDVAVMGFDDIEIASVTAPKLTTVAVRPLEQGEAIGRVLLNRLNDLAPAAPRRILFDPAVVPRESA